MHAGQPCCQVSVNEFSMSKYQTNSDEKIQHLRFCEPVICKFDDTLPTTSLVMIKYIK